jgi:hypothetical protein
MLPYPEIQVHKDYDAKLEQFSSHPSTIVNKIILLTDEQIEDSTQYLIFYYQKGTRHNFAFGFGGLT